MYIYIYIYIYTSRSGYYGAPLTTTSDLLHGTDKNAIANSLHTKTQKEASLALGGRRAGA